MHGPPTEPSASKFRSCGRGFEKTASRQRPTMSGPPHSSHPNHNKLSMHGGVRACKEISQYLITGAAVAA